MTGKKLYYLLTVILTVAIAYLGWRLTSRSGYESAEYSVLESNGPFELREYPDFMLVTWHQNCRLTTFSRRNVYAA